MMRAARLAAALGLLLPASCAAPPLRLYTLGGQNQAAPPSQEGTRLAVIDLPRVGVPDYLDSADILVRDGQVLRRSSRARLASRLSIEASDLLRARLAARYPSLMITAQAPLDERARVLLVTITRLDIAADGRGTLVADWTIAPPDPRSAASEKRAALTATGPVGTDGDVVALEHDLLLRLADRIVLPASASAPRGP